MLTQKLVGASNKLWTIGIFIYLQNIQSGLNLTVRFA